MEPITVTDHECTSLRFASRARRRRARYRALGRAVLLGLGAASLVIFGAALQAWAG